MGCSASVAAEPSVQHPEQHEADRSACSAVPPLALEKVIGSEQGVCGPPSSAGSELTNTSARTSVELRAVVPASPNRQTLTTAPLNPDPAASSRSAATTTQATPATAAAVEACASTGTSSGPAARVTAPVLIAYNSSEGADHAAALRQALVSRGLVVQLNRSGVAAASQGGWQHWGPGDQPPSHPPSSDAVSLVVAVVTKGLVLQGMALALLSGQGTWGPAIPMHVLPVEATGVDGVNDHASRELLRGRALASTPAPWLDAADEKALALIADAIVQRLLEGSPTPSVTPLPTLASDTLLAPHPAPVMAPSSPYKTTNILSRPGGSVLVAEASPQGATVGRSKAPQGPSTKPAGALRSRAASTARAQAGFGAGGRVGPAEINAQREPVNGLQEPGMADALACQSSWESLSDLDLTAPNGSVAEWQGDTGLCGAVASGAWGEASCGGGGEAGGKGGLSQGGWDKAPREGSCEAGGRGGVSQGGWGEVCYELEAFEGAPGGVLRLCLVDAWFRSQGRQGIARLAAALRSCNEGKTGGWVAEEPLAVVRQGGGPQGSPFAPGAGSEGSAVLSSPPVPRGQRPLPPPSASPLQALEIAVSDAASAKALAEALALMPAVRRLDLGGSVLGPGGMVALAPALPLAGGACGGLAALYLGCCALGQGGAAALSSALAGLPGLRLLDLSLNALSPLGAEALVPGLLAVRGSLRYLDLRSNSLGAAGAAALAPALRCMAMLRRLNVSYNTLQAKGAAALASALPALAGSLRSLNLNNNSLGAEGMHQLRPAICLLSGLRELSLAANNLCLPGGAGALAAALAPPVAHALRTLDVTGNAIGAGGAQALVPALGCMAQLRQLLLGYNQLGPEGALALAPPLRQLMHLQHVDLQGNGLGAGTGGQALSGLPVSYF